VINPSLLELGSVSANEASPNVFAPTVKLVKTVGILLIVNNAVIVPDTKLVVLSCSAVMVEEPLPTMVIVLPSIVATDESHLA
jgi:hypothetical protein